LGFDSDPSVRIADEGDEEWSGGEVGRVFTPLVVLEEGALGGVEAVVGVSRAKGEVDEEAWSGAVGDEDVSERFLRKFRS
jgi:hypothetical protein